MTHAEIRPHPHGLWIQQVPSLGLKLLKWGFGSVFFGGGLFFLWLMVEGPLSYWREGGWHALPEALPGWLVSTLFCAILLPLGGWMLFMRSRWRVDLSTREWIEEVDWRIGRRTNAHAIADFHSLWLGMDEIAPSSKRHSTHALTLQAQPKTPDTTPRLMLAWFDPDQRPAARDMAQVLSQATGLAWKEEPPKPARRH